MKDAREILLIIKGRDTGLESLPFPLKWLFDHNQEIEFPDGCSLPVSDLIYFESDYDLLVWEQPCPLDNYHVSESEIVLEDSGGVCTLSDRGLALPKYARLGSPTGTAMRLDTSDSPIKREYQYWRDAGFWGIAVVPKPDGKFYTIDKDMPWLNDLELFPITREEYAHENQGYYSMRDSDYDAEPTDIGVDDSVLPF